MAKQLSAIALGANLGKPTLTFNHALEKISALPATHIVARSSFYQSAAVGPAQDDYINAAILIRTSLHPLELLKSLQAIEDNLGRQREVERWGPRLIDLDIISYGQLAFDSSHLSIPHPHAYHRCFVLAPLAELAPQLVLPGYGIVSDLLASCDSGATRLLKTNCVLSGEPQDSGLTSSC